MQAMGESLQCLWGCDADAIGAAGVDGAAWYGLGALVHADFDGGEAIVATTEGETGGGEGGVGSVELGQKLGWWEGYLVVESR